MIAVCQRNGFDARPLTMAQIRRVLDTPPMVQWQVAELCALVAAALGDGEATAEKYLVRPREDDEDDA